MTPYELLLRITFHDVVKDAARRGFRIEVRRNDDTGDSEIRFHYERSLVVSMSGDSAVDETAFQKKVEEVKRGILGMCDFLVEDGK